jgi:hypothetical protein
MLGHASESFTMSQYQHVTDRMTDRAATALEAGFREADLVARYQQVCNPPSAAVAEETFGEGQPRQNRASTRCAPPGTRTLNPRIKRPKRFVHLMTPRAVTCGFVRRPVRRVSV